MSSNFSPRKSALKGPRFPGTSKARAQAVPRAPKAAYDAIPRYPGTGGTQLLAGRPGFRLADDSGALPRRQLFRRPAAHRSRADRPGAALPPGCAVGPGDQAAAPPDAVKRFLARGASRETTH